MRGIVGGLGSVAIMVAGLALCLILAFYDALKQSVSATVARGETALHVTNGHTDGPSPST